MVDSCRTCANCREGFEQFCEAGPTFTYNSPDKVLGGILMAATPRTWSWTRLLSCTSQKTRSDCRRTPLLCAGITTYSPFATIRSAQGKKVGVVGLGGLGHMGVNWPVLLAHTVVLFTTSPGKSADGKRLGSQMRS